MKAKACKIAENSHTYRTTRKYITLKKMLNIFNNMSLVHYETKTIQ